MQNRTLISASFVLSLAASVLGAVPAFAASPGNYDVMIMTHLCKSSIRTAADFNAMENGKTPIHVLGDDVVACPTTGLVSSTPVAGTIAAPRTAYDFSVTSDTQTRTLSANGSFMPIKACESNIGFDLNADGVIATSTCLDISHYSIPVTTSGASSTLLKVVETQAPAGYHFGLLRFTPVALDGNNDSQSLTYLDPQNAEIDLNLVPDTDSMIMLHVYQFQNATTSGGGTTTPPVGTTTPPTASTTPNSVSGIVFNDANGNDMKDAGEAGLPGFMINLHTGDGYGAPIGQTATSDANGRYVFPSLAIGTYFLEEVLKTGWNQTSSDMKVLLTTANSTATVDFANMTIATTSVPGMGHDHSHESYATSTREDTSDRSGRTSSRTRGNR
jgi:hypothetical protein